MSTQHPRVPEAGAGASTPRRRRPVSVTSVLRTLLVGGAAAGLAYGATQAPASWSARWPGVPETVAQSRAGAAAVTGTDLSCPAEELSGTEGVDDVPVPGTLGVASAPIEALRPALGSASLPRERGSVRVGLVTGRTLGSPTTTRGEVTSTAYRGRTPLLVSGTGSLAAGVAGLQQWAVSTSTMRGLAGVACGAAAPEAWLVGGGGQAGRQERLTLSNPGANPVTVDVSMLGARGPVQSPVGEGITVPGHGRTSLLLDALSATESSPVVHVAATGGVVRATLTDSWLDGTRPRGVDDAAPTAGPARAVTLPGVLPGAGEATLRVAVPGDRGAVVQARALTRAGRAALVRGGVSRVDGGATLDIPVGDLPEGTVALQVTADVPVVAGVLVTRGQTGAEQPGDLAWAAGSRAVTGVAGTPLPDVKSLSGLSHQLVLATPVGRPARLTLTTLRDGRPQEQQVDLAADTARAVDLQGAGAAWVTPHDGSQVHAAVVTTAGSGAAQQITVSALADAPVRAATSQLVPAAD